MENRHALRRSAHWLISNAICVYNKTNTVDLGISYNDSQNILSIPERRM